MIQLSLQAVVPGYYLVCYNPFSLLPEIQDAVVPGYYLVCYNEDEEDTEVFRAVVPGYYLVCYNGVTVPGVPVPL